jgi:DNA invertase Pin-like site-specific DNA recombinase
LDREFLFGFLAIGKNPMKAGLYARVSTVDQHTLPLQIQALKKYAKSRRWKIALQIEEVGSGASDRPKREELLKAARQRKIDVIIVWRLDRWGRSVSDLVGTLEELNELEVGFISLMEALDLTTAAGRAMAKLLAVFSEFERDLLRERVKAGIAHAKKLGKPHGRPITIACKADRVKQLFSKGVSKAEIARKLDIGRTSVRRLLGVLSRNRRNFRHPKSNPATSASKSIILPSLWKV